ncbi:venom acid phosphatase Acph-1-like [Phymastichus coffea]|uniref:venom acid phosphatase Acph-1-like n=1 Tax=Phymastichus coffea TaxID=108790 RepID=UPI00273B7BEF|nr:venom acid phosphatase Acph-1-like [Phymastichus coffea]XP_058807174.1 venom acid phosphatase Acph-1-like [Phymastichus coffea]
MSRWQDSAQRGRTMRRSVLLLVGALSLVGTESALGKLELIQVLFRNGERTPYPAESYPLDPYALGRHYTSAGGRLTEQGRWRAHRLGRALRLHYEGQLPLPERPEDVYAYSADVPCCHESMSHVLEGLYDGNERAARQVRVRMLPRATDVLTNSRQCSRFRAEADRLRGSPEMQRMLAKYEGLYRYLRDNTGLSLDGPRVDESLYELYGLLEAQMSVNLTLPDWCSEGVFTLLQEIAFLHHELESRNDRLKRLNGGPLLRRFLDSVRRSGARNRVHLYAAEARNVAALARAMNKSYPRLPGFGSAIVLEKWRHERGGNFVRIVVWTGSTEKMFALQLRDCAEMCPLDEFARRVKSVLPTDDDARCLLDDLRTRP